MIDSIQWSTGCTRGKGKMKVEEAEIPVARFCPTREELEIILREEILEKIERIPEEQLKGIQPRLKL